ncbi:MAG: hypothetical protein FWG50_09475, partial [Kiritimatiellaeota bacterium]|nr:hypothetical protein [Kiritimatiellota bacterium]
ARRGAKGAGSRRNVSNGSRGRSPSIVKSVFYRTLAKGTTHDVAPLFSIRKKYVLFRVFVL